VDYRGTVVIVQLESLSAGKIFAKVRSGVSSLSRTNTDIKNEAVLTDAFKLRLLLCAANSALFCEGGFPVGGKTRQSQNRNAEELRDVPFRLLPFVNAPRGQARATQFV
jgi:hypothetical protein